MFSFILYLVIDLLAVSFFEIDGLFSLTCLFRIWCLVAHDIFIFKLKKSAADPVKINTT